MNKFKATAVFYVIALVVVFGLNKLSPGQQDGGLGFGGLSIILLVIMVFALLCFNLYKAIRHGKDYFLLAVIHLLVLLVIVGKLFL